MNTTRRRVTLPEYIVLGVAFVWGVLVIVGAGTMPLYSGESIKTTYDPVTGTSATSATTVSATLVGQNGGYAYIIAALPLVAVTVIALAMALRDPRRGTPPVAWIVLGLFGAFNLLAMLTVGVFFLPVTACLLAACIIRQLRRTTEQLAASRQALQPDEV